MLVTCCDRMRQRYRRSCSQGPPGRVASGRPSGKSWDTTDEKSIVDTQITELLRRVREGDSEASQELVPLVYAELRNIAGKYLRKERKDHTLRPTELVNEVYIRMFGSAAPNVADKAHFLAIASQMMRRILVDYARTRASGKRGGDLHRIQTAGLELETGHGDFLPLLELHRALDLLAAENPVLAQAIEMRYFGGLTADEAAEVTGRSVHSVRHDLRFAQAWLRRTLAGE
jgi:RNA polymerase sigma-70 factor, ECF subfamily